MNTGKHIKEEEDEEIADSLEINSEILAERIHEGANFPKIAREACKLIGIHLDDQGYWWLWNPLEYRWELRDMVDIFNAVDDKLVDSTNTIDAKIKTPLKEALERQARRNKPEVLDWKWVQFKENLYNFETGEIKEASSKYFVSNPIPWNVGTSTETPELDKLLDDWISKRGEDKKDINILKDLFAFCLPTKYFIKLVPFLYGGGNDGKSQFIKIMVKFLGKDNCTATTLQYMENSNFGTYNCFKKLLCQINEVPKNEMKKFTNIKSISGRDETPVEAKGKNSRKEELYSKIFMVGNDIPITRDESNGFWERIHPIEFPNYFEEKGDIFELIPKQEFENLAAWCLQRLKVLSTTYKVTGKKSIKDTREEYKLQANQLIKFLKDIGYIITHDQSQKVMVTILNSEYNQWADSLGKPIMEGTEFKAKLQNLGLTVEPTHCVIDGVETRRNYCFGIKKASSEELSQLKQQNLTSNTNEGQSELLSDTTDTTFQVDTFTRACDLKKGIRNVGSPTSTNNLVKEAQIELVLPKIDNSSGSPTSTNTKSKDYLNSFVKADLELVDGEPRGKCCGCGKFDLILAISREKRVGFCEKCYEGLD